MLCSERCLLNPFLFLFSVRHVKGATPSQTEEQAVQTALIPLTSFQTGPLKVIKVYKYRVTLVKIHNCLIYISLPPQENRKSLPDFQKTPVPVIIPSPGLGQSAAELRVTTGNSRGEGWELEEGRHAGEGVMCVLR